MYIPKVQLKRSETRSDGMAETECIADVLTTFSHFQADVFQNGIYLFYMIIIIMLMTRAFPPIDAK